VTDQLFLMKPGFTNAGMGPFYCGDSVSVEGLLGFFPQLRDLIQVTYVDFARPRAPIVTLIGEENQSVPVLVIDGEAPSGTSVRRAGDVAYIDNEKAIRAYLSEKFGLPTAG
jgi:hypothetical protein